MLEKLEQIEARYEELANELSSQELLSNPSAYAKAAKQHRTLEEIVEKYRSLRSLRSEMAGARELLETADDEEMLEMARAEVNTLQERIETADNELKILILPTDPND